MPHCCKNTPSKNEQKSYQLEPTSHRCRSSTFPGKVPHCWRNTSGKSQPKSLCQEQVIISAKNDPKATHPFPTIQLNKCSLQKQSLFFNEKTSLRRELFFNSSIGTFGFVFFSLQGLRKGSRPPTDPKMPFPYWKNDYFVTHMSSRYTIHLQIKKNQLKSGRDG